MAQVHMVMNWGEFDEGDIRTSDSLTKATVVCPIRFVTLYCQSTHSTASLHTVLPVYTQYCQSTHSNASLQTVMPVYTQ